MYKMSYAEVMEGSATAARERERSALDHAIELMRLAEAKGAASPEASEAVQYV